MADDLHDSASTSLVDLVAEQVKKTPDSIAVIYDGVEESSCLRITYSEMWQRADQVCRELQTLGAQRETVGVCTKPGINIPSILLGILQASSSYMPFGEDGHGFVKQSIQRLGITYLLLDGSTLQNLESLLLDLRVKIVPSECLQSLGIYVGQIQGGSSERQLRQVPNLAYCITTSGTTGTPKIVRVPHACIVPNILDFRREFQPSPGDITFLTSPLTFDPSVVDLFTTLSSGAAVLIVAPVVKMSGDALLTMLTSRHKVTILQITPSLFRSMDAGKVKMSLLGADSPLKVLAFGGEGFPSGSTLNDCLHPDNGATIYNVYGVTEVSCWASLYKARLPKGCVKDAVPIGKVLTGTRVKVVDEQDTEVEGGVGHIMIGGSERVCLLNDEDEEVLRSGIVWRGTGDMGLVHNNGDIHCLGRNDRQIKRHGKRLDLDTLEKVASQLTSVKNCQAVHKEDRLFLFLTTPTPVDAEGVNVCRDVQNHVQKVLPSQYRPDQVMALSAFPVNSHGKLDVGSLLWQLKEKTKQHCPSDAVSVDSWARRLWQDITGDRKEAVSPADTFLSCGGDSLKAVRLVEQVEQRLGQDVPDLLETLLTKTFHDFVSTIRQRSAWNGCGEMKQKSVQHHRNGVSKPLKHVAGNREDVSEPPAKMRRGSSDKSEGNRLNQEHHSNDTNLSVGTSIHNSKNCAAVKDRMECDEFTIAAESLQQEQCEAKKRTCHELLDQNTHVEERAQTAEEKEEDVFVCSIGRANNGWLTEDGVGTFSCLSDVRSSAVNGESSLCSAVEKTDLTDTVKLELCWSCDTWKCVDASPLVGRTRSGRAVVFIGSHSHHFFAIDVCSGRVLWSTELGDRVESSACLSPCGRRVIVGCYDHKVYVLKVESGIIEWQVTTGDIVKCSPVADAKSHLVFCGSHDGFMYALNCKTQKVAWKSWMGGGGVFASPVLSRDSSSVYTATLRGHVTSVSALTGALVWRVCVGKPVFSSPAVHNDHLYVGCVDSCFYCLSCTTGIQLWVYRTQAPIFSSPVIMRRDNRDPCILFGSHDSCLHCISHTGHPVWKHHFTSTVYASPFLFGLGQATESGAAGVFGAEHHTEESGQDLRPNFCSQHVAKNLKDQTHVRGSELSCTSQLDANSQKREQRTSFLPELDSERPVSSNRLKNGGSELSCGQTKTNCELYKREEEHKVKSNCSSSTRSETCPSKSQSGDDHSGCGRFVACASTDGVVRILNCATGKLSGQVCLPGEVFSSPLVVDDRLIVGCRDDKVYCYKLGHPS